MVSRELQPRSPVFPGPSLQPHTPGQSPPPLVVSRGSRWCTTGARKEPRFSHLPIGVGIRVWPQSLPAFGPLKGSMKAKELTRDLETPGYRLYSRRLALGSSAGVSPIPTPHSQAPSVEPGGTVATRARKALRTRAGQVFAREKLSAGKLGAKQGQQCPQFDTHSPHPQTPLPQGEKENSYLLAQPWVIQAQV